MKEPNEGVFAIMFGLVLFGMFYIQAATAPGSQYVGHWEGTLTYKRSNKGWPTNVEITDLVIETDLKVSGKFGDPAADPNATRIGGDKARISPDGKFDVIMFWIGKERAFMQFSGTTKLSDDQQTLTSIKIIVVDTGRSPGNTDDERCDGTLTLKRKSPGT